MDELRERLVHTMVLTITPKGETTWGALVDAVLAEIGKTHRIVKRRNGYQGPTHGTLTCYTYHQCRCSECRAANAEQGRKRRRLERERREQG